MVLVTGGSGFVGRAVVQALACSGRQVVGAVRHMPAVNHRDTQRIVWQPVGDISEQTHWSPILRGVETVVHCAARAHVMRETEQDALNAYRRVNVGATLRLASQAAEAGVRRFVFISSIGVNGNQSGKPFSEADDPHPHDHYAISKFEAEQALLALASRSNLEVVIIRPPLVYGPGAPGNFASLVRWVRRGVPLPLGAVHNRRSLVALDNLVNFITLCADPERSPRAANQVFLISDGEYVSTTELLRKVACAYGVSPRLLPVPVGLLRMAAGALGKRAVADKLLGSLVVDSSKARELLGWKPVISMDEQLQKMALHDSLA